MLVLGLLLLALVCLILGLILTSAGFLIGSVAASLIAGFVLWRQRGQLGQSDTKPGAATAPSADSLAAESPALSRQNSLVTGTAFAKKSVPEADAAPAPAPAPSTGSDESVWVVNGQPLFHKRHCDELADQDPGPIPYAQAIEDGFTECSACKPRVSAHVMQVWVVDGKPGYHLKDCAQAGPDAEQAPRAQAVEDGFTACPDCRPDAPDAPDAPAAEEQPPARVAALSDGVWVVDGRPRYHLADCLIIKDLVAEEIPLAQATEDGFIPCSMCEPNVTRV
jgi:hypothetical protein